MQNLSSTSSKAPTERTSLIPPRGRGDAIFDDVATLHLKYLGATLVVSQYFWMCGGTVRLLQLLFPLDNLLSWRWAGATLCICGSLMGLTACVLVLSRVLTRSRLMSDEERCANIAAGYTFTNTRIAYSSLPLFRLLLCLVGVAILGFLSIIASEVSFLQIICILILTRQIVIPRHYVHFTVPAVQ